MEDDPDLPAQPRAVLRVIARTFFDFAVADLPRRRRARGNGGSELELDAVEFCRVLSGRGHGEGLLGVEVPF